MADLKGMGGEETGDTIIFTKDWDINTHVLSKLDLGSN